MNGEKTMTTMVQELRRISDTLKGLVDRMSELEAYPTKESGDVMADFSQRLGAVEEQVGDLAMNAEGRLQRIVALEKRWSDVADAAKPRATSKGDAAKVDPQPAGDPYAAPVVPGSKGAPPKRGK